MSQAAVTPAIDHSRSIKPGCESPSCRAQQQAMRTYSIPLASALQGANKHEPHSEKFATVDEPPAV